MYISFLLQHAMRVFFGLSRLGAECRLQEMEEMLTKRTEMLVVVKQEL